MRMKQCRQLTGWILRTFKARDKCVMLIEDLTGLFSPPPPSFRKEMDNIYVQFRRIFVEFVVLLTKIWPTNRIYRYLALQLNDGERDFQRAVFAPPPLHIKK